MPDFLHVTYDLNDPDIAAVVDQVSLWAARFGLFLLSHLDLRPNQNILDVACGTGFPLFELVQMHGASCRVTGVDIWKQGLERARLKAHAYQSPNVQILEADASQLPWSACRHMKRIAEPKNPSAPCCLQQDFAWSRSGRIAFTYATWMAGGRSRGRGARLCAPGTQAQPGGTCCRGTADERAHVVSRRRKTRW